MAEDRVLSQLGKARERLLDLTMRNRLLNFVPTKRQTIRVIDELPGEIWRLLVVDGKKMGFLAREEHELFDGRAADAAADDERTQDGGDADVSDTADVVVDTVVDTYEEVFVLPELDVKADAAGSLPGRYRDTNLQTALSRENLHTNLLRIYQAATSGLQERGVNFLFLAVGFLEWKQPATHGDRVFKAPILLIPVGLERSSAKSRFKLFALDDDPVLNPCLVRKLKDERIVMPPCVEADDWDGFDIDAYWAKVEQAVAEQPGWSVSREVHLGLFSFTKYLMYVDLDAHRWPIADNPLIRALCGDETALPSPADLPDAGEAVRQIAPEQMFQVLDADSSQQRAILRAKTGQSLVIEGPPGTGKSQTITNIIAECLAQGRTVLFVSEKMAALEVVKSRLDAVGLGDFVLELHSTKANRKNLTAELTRVLEKGRQTGKASDGEAGKLSAATERLDAYVHALHDPHGPAGLTPFGVMGRILLLRDVPNVDADMPGLATWSTQQLDGLKELTASLSRALSTVCPPGEHPWRGSRLTLATGQMQRAAADLATRLSADLANVTEAARAVAVTMDVSPPDTLAAAGQLLNDATLLTDSPGPAERLLSEPAWDNPPAELTQFLGDLQTYAELRQWAQGRYKLDAVEATDWAAMRDRCLRFWGGWSRWLRRNFWTDRKTVKAVRVDGGFPKFAEIADDLKRLAEMQRLRAELERARSVGETYFDAAWRGPAGSKESQEAVLAMGTWLRKFRECVRRGGIGPTAIGLAAAGADRGQLTTARDALRQAMDVWQADWTAMAAAIQMDESTVPGPIVEQTPLPTVARRLERMAEEHESLLDWAQFQEVLQAGEKGPLVGFFAKALAAVHANQLDADVLPLAMEKQFLGLWLDGVLAERPVLRKFNAKTHEAATLDFALRDRQWVEQTGGRLQARLAADRPATAGKLAPTSQLGILSGEIRRKRGGRSIRKLLMDARDAVQKLKPCLMMSPQSVAQFIDPAGMRFDVVVFDEASQVEPADALGAVGRGGQLILVGDPKQLPPTSFFAGLGVEAESVEEDDGAASLADMESILDKGSTVLPSTRLRWHYRSRHESLIAFSNREFYDNDLVVFPSSHADRAEQGLSMRLEASDLYDRGRSQTNRDQAKRIAAYVFEHARTCPNRTLGVGAFSQRQQQAIWDEIERLRRKDDSVESFFDPNGREPFFVKNLETIQGDERDVILLSVGYGRSQNGERVSMNFGPLNQDGGWRRLNVLVTRARQKCVVFSSIRGDDLDLSATQARGVRSLKGYLDYAQTGRLPEIEVGQGEFGSDFEQAVHNALVEKGLQLHTQVGCAGYAIDLAVVDPENPGRYLLGIECDGATYHHSATARDRDRLRQQVLEGLGWRIHRIWSTEWFQKPQTEVQRVLEAVQQAKAGLLRPRFIGGSSTSPATSTSPASAAPKPTSPSSRPKDSEPAAAQPQSPDALIPTQPYKCFAPKRVLASEKFYTESVPALAKLVTEIVAFEGPIHEEELARRMATAFGMTRAGGQIVLKVTKAVSHAEQRNTVTRRGPFLWPADMTTPPVRVRDGNNKDAPRDIDRICPEEIGQAAWLLLKAQFGMSRQDLITQTARALGFNNTGPNITATIDTALTLEQNTGRIQTNGS
ncbi:MAG: DUF3320 domain-containing protein, partial [Phycisphaerae bacterium]|nr:DUF3320 domain-containing protein [Phycisphaerae bacterium]